MGATTLEVDRDAREIFNTAAIAIGTHDAEAAFDVCRKLVAIEEHYRFALRVGDDAPNAKTSSSTTSGFRHMAAKFAGRCSKFAGRCSKCAGRCSKCARAISVGTPIAYDATNRRAFHEECAA